MAWEESEDKLIFTTEPETGVETPDLTDETEEFENACAQFRQVCGEIGTLIDVENFRGGFDDMPTFYAHDAYKTITGLCLAMAWKGLDTECTYLGAKIGLGQPEWWRRCWELAESGGGSNPVTYDYKFVIDSIDVSKHSSAYVDLIGSIQPNNPDVSEPTDYPYFELEYTSEHGSTLELHDYGTLNGVRFYTQRTLEIYRSSNVTIAEEIEVTIRCTSHSIEPITVTCSFTASSGQVPMPPPF